MKRFKTAVFGAGFVGRVHIEGLRRLGNVDVVAVVAVDDETARQLGEQLSIPRTSSNYREILEDSSIDAVHICTPNALHFPMAKDALAAGKHVICEKPLADFERRGAPNGRRRAGRKRAQLHVPQSALLSHGAADAPHARSGRPGRNYDRAGHLLAGLAALRHRLELARRYGRTTAPRAAWPISARTGATWRNTSPASASPRFAPI